MNAAAPVVDPYVAELSAATLPLKYSAHQIGNLAGAAGMCLLFNLMTMFAACRVC